MLKRLSLAAAMVTAAAAPAFAHLDPLEHGSFAAGFSHPLFGMDHILVMVSVGLWAAQLARAAQISGSDSASKARTKPLWLVPSAFVATMAAGFLLAVAGIELPFVEPAILASVIALADRRDCGPHAGCRLRRRRRHLRPLPRPCPWRRTGRGGRPAVRHRLPDCHRPPACCRHRLGLAVSHLSPKLARLLGGFTALAGLSMVFG